MKSHQRNNTNVKKQEVLTSVFFVLVLPLLTSAFAGICAASGERIMRAILSQPAATKSFFEEFLSVFSLFFPIISVIMVIVLIITTVKNRKKNYIIVTVLVVISLALSWNLGGNKLFKSYQNVMNDQLELSIYFAYEFQKIGKTDDAIKNYKTSLFIDKYIVLWNENNRIPEYYAGIAQSYASSEKLEDADKYFDKSINAYQKYNPSDSSEIAWTHTHAALVTSALDNNSKTLSHTLEASAFYKEHPPKEEEKRTAAYAFIWLANAYYNDKRYDVACEYFELGIPLFYETVQWGVGDESDAKLLAICYKVAALSFDAGGNAEKSEEYHNEYNEFVWFRDFTEGDLEPIISYFHWMKP